MSHPDPRHDPSNVIDRKSPDQFSSGNHSKRSPYIIKEKVKKYKYGMNKPGNNVDRLLRALENKKK